MSEVNFLMSHAAKYLLTTEISIKRDGIETVKESWLKTISNFSTFLYQAEESDSLLEIRGFNTITEFSEFLEQNVYINNFKNISHFFESDFSQELLLHKQDVVPQSDELPSGLFLQMRHIEVPLKVYDEYLNWRSETIFKHVRNLENIDSFTAYHSLLSKQPGVMFLSSFSCEPELYLPGFKNSSYGEIVKQAGKKYITGGKNALYTKIYKRCI
jgi:hypothetical protein